MENQSVMSLEVEAHGEAVVLTPHGRIAEVEARQLERELLRQIAEGRTKIVVDLTDVPFVTSATLGAFMLAHKRGRDTGGSVRLVSPQPLVLQILQVTKLTKLFGLYDTVPAALQFD